MQKNQFELKLYIDYHKFIDMCYNECDYQGEEYGKKTNK